MNIIDYWIFCAAVIAAYAVAVIIVAAMWHFSGSEDVADGKCSEAARAAFRKWFRFAN